MYTILYYYTHCYLLESKRTWKLRRAERLHCTNLTYCDVCSTLLFLQELKGHFVCVEVYRKNEVMCSWNKYTLVSPKYAQLLVCTVVISLRTTAARYRSKSCNRKTGDSHSKKLLRRAHGAY